MKRDERTSADLVAPDGRFSWVQIAVVGVVLGVLAVLVIPVIRRVQLDVQATKVAINLQRFANDLRASRLDTGSWPVSSMPGVPPTAVTDRLCLRAWRNGIPGRGSYAWGRDVNGVRASLAIVGGQRNDRLFAEIDRIIDDGNTGTGRFRWMNDRYVYVLKE
ncbi:MAG: hypothetical protein ACHQ4G_06725 [Opitutales bacterium]